MIIENQQTLTDMVLAAMEGTQNARLKEIMTALVKALHQFARDARLTEEEFEVGLQILNRIGQETNDSHNEAVLFSDILGFSTLVCLLNNGNSGATETAAALLGPFWRKHSPSTENGGTIVRSKTEGPPLYVRGRITDPKRHAIADVEVDVWQASPVGLYENQDESQVDMNLRGKFMTDANGEFWFRSVKPAGYPVPTHGPAGDLLRAQNRHPYRPAHLHFLGFKHGFKTLITQVFVDGDERLNSDVVFGVTRHLIGEFKEHADTPSPDDPSVTHWCSLDYDFMMEPGEAKLPVPPIK
ncbi:dioxygenase family protein [Rhizobium lentis]|uniref:Catechol 1,2-dioxygenase n=1 Tax=Rhizobium lentis TaxID=1138194 RepID=A0ABS7I9C9_9HYPH|nr:dioxygenase [Rhizobium lentis]MBX5041198.1 catechol 1,2-dioxygenase [Rhizobium lentis]MBX5051897.1 catechol 1,2-dioxygenase [Rhizobium lentis]MBX5071455.1 catechol 1,2-dioxygenase [Rhizobium lentis]MBX5088437.1 catechol 1,2-dioxygenase [Rhizobium lentis]MBX5108507.1 catechol 1,2-dioxygenase [Rhizobium lentis]